MRLVTHTSSSGGGGFTSNTAGASAVAAVEDLGGTAAVFDGRITRGWPGAGSGCGCGEDEGSDERGDQRCKKQHCTCVKR